MIRDRDVQGQTGGWRPLLSPPERLWSHVLWNLRRRVDDRILSRAGDLAYVLAQQEPILSVQQSLPYLVVPRAGLAGVASGVDRQFAVIHTLG